MTYPPPNYHGPGGQVSASHRPAGTPPELVYDNGTRAHYLSTGAATGGLFALYRWQSRPAASGPAQHFHRSLTESFFILSGVIRIYDGDRCIDARSGDYVHVPMGGIHSFRNESGEPASMLLHFSPGAPREGYFEGLTRLAEMDEAERTAFFLEHDNIWV